MSFLYIPVSRGTNGSNTFVGSGALASITTGEKNSAFGYRALAANTTGSWNVAVGADALLRNISGESNIAIGDAALSANTQGTDNIGIGKYSLFSTDVSGICFRNIAVGRDAGFSLENGSNNAFFGYRSGYLITTADDNSILGAFQGNLHGVDIRTASNNIVLSDGDGNPRYAFLNATNEHLWKAGGAGATVGRLLQSITGASTDALFDITGTWNTTGAANGIRLNVTDTASAAGALLMDLRVGGVSRARVTKSGNLGIGGNLILPAATGIIVADGGAADGEIFISSVNSGPMISVSDTGIAIAGGFGIGFSNGAANRLTRDLYIARDAADTLAQRRGVNAQAFRIYNTFTDASNYERLLVRWSSNIAALFTDAAGSGTHRNLQIGTLGNASIFFVTAGSTRISINDSGNFLFQNDNSNDIGAAAASRPRNLFLGSYMQLSEMTAPAAPAANSVRIYAVDNGSGKTQLMALFATGAAQQIAIEP